MNGYSGTLWLVCLSVLGLACGCATTPTAPPTQPAGAPPSPAGPTDQPVPGPLPTAVVATTSATPPRAGGQLDHRDLFSVMDTDGNGVISLDEFRAFQDRRAARMKQQDTRAGTERSAPRHSPEEMFARLDTDNNGILSRDEMEARDRTRLRRNGDRADRTAGRRARTAP